MAALDACGVFLKNGYAFAVAAFGIWEAGGTVVPMDPDWPDARLSHVAAVCEMTTLLTIADHHARAAGIPGIETIILLDDPADPKLDTSSSRMSDLSGREAMSTDDVAYILFTSGTTGQPKGVPITHANLMQLLRWQETAFGLNRRLTSVQVLPVTFDFGLEEVLNLLCFGGTLHVPEVADVVVPERYAERCVAAGATMLYVTPSHLRRLLDAVDFRQFELILVGGEKFSWELAEALRARTSTSARIFNGYGPTETTITATTHPLQPGDRIAFEGTSSVPIGKPCSANRVYVLDEFRELVPPGAVGEVFIGGAGLSPGYLRDPALTDSRFLPDPFTPVAAARMYRTGDRARLLADGSIEFLGRADRQVKFHGFRIELDEIAAAIRAHPEISEAQVDCDHDAIGRTMLFAFCVPCTRRPDLLGDLARHVATYLPMYMRPELVLVDAIQLTSNGKADTAAMRASVQPAVTKTSGAVRSNRAALLGHVLDAWRSALGIPDLAADQDVFANGASSLSVLEVHATLSDRLGFRFDIARLFERTTPAALANMLSDAPRAPAGTAEESERGAMQHRALRAAREHITRGRNV